MVVANFIITNLPVKNTAKGLVKHIYQICYFHTLEKHIFSTFKVTLWLVQKLVVCLQLIANHFFSHYQLLIRIN